MLTLVALAPPSLSAESKTFFGIDAVEIETNIEYQNGSEDYVFTAARFRYGIENSEGGSAGFELVSSDSDDIIDPFGNPFRLEKGESFGVYFTVGKPVYLRLGVSTWRAEYTDITTDLTDKETVNSLDIGLGFNFSLNRNLTVYADYSIKDTDAEFPLHVSGSGEVDYESEILALGLNFLF